MEFIKQHIEGVWVIQPKRFGDARGYFSETFKLEEFRKHVGDVEFVQDNESFSTYGVLRGLHFQKGEFSQAKLVRVSRGKVLDVAVDLRGGRPSGYYGRECRGRACGCGTHGREGQPTVHSTRICPRFRGALR